MSDGLYVPFWEDITGDVRRKCYQIWSSDDDDAEHVSVDVRETADSMIFILLTWDNQTVTLTLPELRAVNCIIEDFKEGD